MQVQEIRFKWRDKTSKAALRIQDNVADTLEYTVFSIIDKQLKPVLTTALVDGKELCVEVDTGASISLIETTFLSLWSKQGYSQRQPLNVKLRAYTGQIISLCGLAIVKVQSSGLGCQWNVPYLLGGDWLAKWRLDRRNIFNLQAQQRVEEILDQHAEVFRKEFGLLKGVEAKLCVDPERLCKAQVVPYALHQKVEGEIDVDDSELLLKSETHRLKFQAACV